MSSTITTLLSILFFFNIPFRSLHKKNAYGDKDVVDSVLVMAVPAEQSAAQAPQLYAFPSLIKSSGYRKKRNNAYGDEAVPPTADLTLSKPAPVEQAPTQTGQSYGAAAPAPVEPSGYRKKRNNDYGDEALPPTADLIQSKPAPAEQAPVQADQSYAAVAPVVSSGY